MTLKEIEYFDKPQAGALAERLSLLIDRLLAPLEREWLKGERDGDVPSRVKSLRAVILPQMVNGEIDEQERTRRWRQLADLYLAQQLSLYPPEYFDSPPTREQLLETVERFEEDLTDVARIHRPFLVVVEIGEAIEVGPRASAARTRTRSWLNCTMRSRACWQNRRRWIRPRCGELNFEHVARSKKG